MYISIKFPGGADAAGLQDTLRNSVPEQPSLCRWELETIHLALPCQLSCLLETKAGDSEGPCATPVLFAGLQAQTDPCSLGSTSPCSYRDRCRPSLGIKLKKQANAQKVMFLSTDSITKT